MDEHEKMMRQAVIIKYALAGKKAPTEEQAALVLDIVRGAAAMGVPFPIDELVRMAPDAATATPPPVAGDGDEGEA